MPGALMTLEFVKIADAPFLRTFIYTITHIHYRELRPTAPALGERLPVAGIRASVRDRRKAVPRLHR